MKKFILIALSTILFFSILPTVSAAPLLTDVKLTVKANSEAGLNGDVTVDFVQSGFNYFGKLYLPFKADTSKLYLSWPDNVSVKGYNNNEAPIARVGKSLNYSVTYAGKTANFVIETLKASSGVEDLFINIDESYNDGSTHTIDEMLNDPKHDKACYGSFSFDDRVMDMSIKGRGNYTWIDPAGKQKRTRKPFTITVNEDDKVKLIKGVESKKWNLLANYADSSLLRNKIGYDIAKELGIGIDSRFTDVWMNGKYLGNYLMTPKTDYNAPDGGYVLELDNKIDDEDPQFPLTGLNKFIAGENVITIKDLGDKAAADGCDTDAIKTWMQSMLNAVMDANSDDYLKYIDLDSWAKMYLLQEFYKNYDVVCGSLYMHRDGLSDSDKLIAGPVWDLDNSLGRTIKNEGLGMSDEMQTSPEGWYIDNINGPTAFLQYLGKHEDFKQRVYEIYNEYKTDFEKIPKNIDEQAELIADSANMNFTAYDVNQSECNFAIANSNVTFGSGKYTYNQIVTNTWADYVSNLKGYVRARIAFFTDAKI